MRKQLETSLNYNGLIDNLVRAMAQAAGAASGWSTEQVERANPGIAHEIYDALEPIAKKMAKNADRENS